MPFFQGTSGDDSIAGGDRDDTIVGEAGNDTLVGGDGADSIEGGDGADIIDGGVGRNALDGDDELFGGAGNDTFIASRGADTIDGGDGIDEVDYSIPNGPVGSIIVDLELGTADFGRGVDTLISIENVIGIDDRTITSTLLGDAADNILTAGAGNSLLDGRDGDDILLDRFNSSTLLGGAGDDTIVFRNGSVSVDGGDGIDTLDLDFRADRAVVDLSSGEFRILSRSSSVENIEVVISSRGDDRLEGDEDNNTLFGNLGDDVILGLGGDDALFGEEGRDRLGGGEGNDVLDGGTGDDSLEGGDGFDVFIVSSGDDTIGDLNNATGQDTADRDQTNNDFVDLAPYYDNLEEAKGDLDDDGILNQSNAGEVARGGGLIDYGDNTALNGSITLTGATASDLTFDTVNLTICFLASTMIKTPTGHRRIGELQIGDLVITLDNGAQPIRWIGRRTIRPMDHQRPIRIKANALENKRDLLVSQQHRMMINGWRAELMFGEPEVLIKAKDLVNDQTIIVDCPAATIEYVHVLFDRHEIIFAEGTPSETLFMGEMALRSLDHQASREVLDLFPEIGSEKFRLSTSLARPILKHAEARVWTSVTGSFESRDFAQPSCEVVPENWTVS